MADPNSISEGEHSRVSTTSQSGCCHNEQSRIDWLLWTCAILVLVAYLTQLAFADVIAKYWFGDASHAVFELVNTMWWSMLLAAVFVGVLGRIPKEFVLSILGRGGTWRGLFRATLAGLLMDLCSHGILMVGMQLYKRGASVGQVMAFLIASPWNSLSLTIILIALIGWFWTLTFVLLSVVIALLSGRMFDRLVARGVLPENANAQTQLHSDDFRFWSSAADGLKQTRFTPSLIATILWEGVKDSRMVLRWLLLGIVLAAVIRAFMAEDMFQTYFGPTVIGLSLTVLAATIIEICSEGSSPIAADLLTRGGAPGNSFAFLMAGVSTDYTEVMSIKDTSGSWKLALFLPLVTLPQIIIVGFCLNQFGALN